ncbi:hypothetical protein PHMEG_00011626 [Phytophthora megakarya]|uniref:Uncharacterized protein n=1 Tax=Phytophthora megakarya TaxID=4795 RepID=A0A225WAS1_9STRA|nr:hypothetical protein PHMEG_00011626 [Phytophthora megakarya]
MENVSLSAWKSIATHQKEKRVEAEQTQRHLRAAVIQRARIIHQMKIVIERPLFKENPKVYMYNGDGTALFKNFMGEMDAIYSQTDQVLKQAQFKISSSLTYTPSRTMRQGMEIFDSADAAIIPFEFKSTTRALNKLMLSDPDTSDFQATTNSLTMKNEVTFQLKADEVAKLRIYSAVQKYEEAGRVVFVLRSFTEGQGNLRGYNTEETGWFSVRPGDSTEDCKSAIIEVYTRFTPFSFGEASDGNVDADRFADIVAKSGEKEVNELGQMLEKLLLGEA